MARVVQSACVRCVSEKNIEVKGLDSRLKVLDPFATIKRGFSIVQLSGSSRVVTSMNHVTEGDSVEITVADGSIPAVVGRSDIIKSTNEISSSKRNVSDSKTNVRANRSKMRPLL